MKLDLDNTHRISDFVTVPAGTYLCRITEVREKTTQAGDALCDEGWPVPLPMKQCEQAIDCLSDTHAFWWNHPELGQTIGAFRSESEEKQHWGYIEEILPRYLDFLGDRLSPDRHQPRQPGSCTSASTVRSSCSVRCCRGATAR